MRKAFLCVAALIVVAAAAFCGCAAKLDFNATYHFVYYKTQEDAFSASSISTTVESYGGAGYIVRYGDVYYITVACYYSEDDARTVADNLLKKGLHCGVLSAQACNFKADEEDKSRFEGNLNTLDSLSRLCYNTANSMDKEECDQIAVKGVLADVLISLSALSRNNADNPFTDEISRLMTECEDVSYGYVYSRDVRKLQIVIIDTILNVCAT